MVLTERAISLRMKSPNCITQSIGGLYMSQAVGRAINRVTKRPAIVILLKGGLYKSQATAAEIPPEVKQEGCY